MIDDAPRESRVLAAFIQSERDPDGPRFEDLPEEDRQDLLETAEAVRWFYESDGSDLSESAVRRAVSAVEREASNHGRNYAAGMRLARSIVEQELLDAARESPAPASTGGAETDDDRPTCYACGDPIDEVQDDDGPTCPECGGNPLPPVGSDQDADPTPVGEK